MAHKFCCDEFAKETREVGAFAGGGWAYAGLTERPTGQIEQTSDGGWHVNGCCGGGCYVLSDIKFCPYCGSGLDLTPKPKGSSK